MQHFDYLLISRVKEIIAYTVLVLQVRPVAFQGRASSMNIARHIIWKMIIECLKCYLRKSDVQRQNSWTCLSIVGFLGFMVVCFLLLLFCCWVGMAGFDDWIVDRQIYTEAYDPQQLFRCKEYTANSYRLPLMLDHSTTVDIHRYRISRQWESRKISGNLKKNSKLTTFHEMNTLGTSNPGQGRCIRSADFHTAQ